VIDIIARWVLGAAMMVGLFILTAAAVVMVAFALSMFVAALAAVVTIL